ncbi:MAG: hypothetical protein AB1715_06915 [Acidobacteriota bacterium]
MAKKSPFDSSPRGIVLEESGGDNRSPEMEEKEEPFNPSIHGASRAGRRERAFELSLPALVTGVDTAENKFREKTQVFSISSEEATVWLRSRVGVGTRLDISLDIPKTLILENHLQLHLSGTVTMAQADGTRAGKRQLVQLRLDRKFKLLPIPPSIN